MLLVESYWSTAATVVWNPHLKKEINQVEKIQRFFTRIALKKCRLPKISYEARLELFNLESLEKRRLIFDLTMCYKIINRLTILDPQLHFPLSTRPSRKHPKQITLKTKNTNKSSHSFTNRTAPKWNILDSNIVQAETPSLFKERLSELLQNI